MSNSDETLVVDSSRRVPTSINPSFRVYWSTIGLRIQEHRPILAGTGNDSK